MKIKFNAAEVADQLMRRVVAVPGVIRSTEQDGAIAVKVMREELKAFLFGEKYAAERELTLQGNEGLAFASLSAECVKRILAERG